MTIRITGELTAVEVEQAVFTARYWSRNECNHLYRTAEFDDPQHTVHLPECSRGQYTIPARWAFRDELSEDLGDDRNHARDCRACFRGRS